MQHRYSFYLLPTPYPAPPAPLQGLDCKLKYSDFPNKWATVFLEDLKWIRHILEKLRAQGRILRIITPYIPVVLRDQSSQLQEAQQILPLHERRGPLSFALNPLATHGALHPHTCALLSDGALQEQRILYTLSSNQQPSSKCPTISH